MSDDNKQHERAKKIEDAIKKADAEEGEREELTGNGEKIDKVLEYLGKLHERMDGYEEYMESHRPENTAKAPKEPARLGEEREDEEDEESAACDSDKWRADAARAQALCDKTLQAWGEQAPRWLSGERLTSYRQRLLLAARKYLPKDDPHRTLDINTIKGPVLGLIERAIYDSAYANSMNPNGVPEGYLREIKEVDRSGRTISRWVGDTSVAWAPFRMPIRHVTGINIKGPYA